MLSETTSVSQLHIGQLQVSCLVPSDHPSPEQIRRRMADLAEKPLPDSLASTLEGVLPPTDPSLWFVQRLNLTLDINLSWDREHQARSWSARMVQALNKELHEPTGYDNVVHFKNLEEYLASFLSDLINSQAWGKWFYNAFDGLRLLPISAAIRTALCRDPSVGLAALHRMDQQTVQRILNSLTTFDVSQLLQTWTDQGATTDPSTSYMYACRAIAGAPKGQFETLQGSQGILYLYLEASRNAGKQLGAESLQALDILLDYLRFLNDQPVTYRAALLNMLISGSIDQWMAAFGADRTSRYLPLRTLPHSTLTMIAETFGKSSPKATPVESSAEPRETLFGGVCLLLPLLKNLPLQDATREWPEPAGTTAEAVLRWLILVKSCGRSHAMAAAREPLIQELSGLPLDLLSKQILTDWQRIIRPAHLQSFLATLARWRAENHTMTGSPLVLIPLVPTQPHTALLLDGARGHWIFAVHDRRDNYPLLSSAIKTAQETIKFPHASIYAHPNYMNTLHDHVADAVVTPLTGENGGCSEHTEPSSEPILASLPYLAEELDYFSLPKEFGLSKPVDRALNIAAQGLLKDFTWRLPGFSWSRSAYVYQNFLDCHAIVEREPTRWIVRIGHAPLQVLLNMVGLNRTTCDIPWLDEARLELYPYHD